MQGHPTLEREFYRFQGSMHSGDFQIFVGQSMVHMRTIVNDGVNPFTQFLVLILWNPPFGLFQIPSHHFQTGSVHGRSEAIIFDDVRQSVRCCLMLLFRIC